MRRFDKERAVVIGALAAVQEGCEWHHELKKDSPGLAEGLVRLGVRVQSLKLTMYP
jgi:hypothetical protein